MAGGCFSVDTPHRSANALLANLDRSEALPEQSLADRQSRRPAQEQPIRSNEKPSAGCCRTLASAAS